MKTKYLISGDKSVVVEFGNTIDEDINKKVMSLMKAIEDSNLNKYVDEMIPTYRSLMINYDPINIDFDAFLEKLKDLESNIKDVKTNEKNIIEIHVLYGGEYGEDIANVAKHNNLTEEEVIKIHSSKEYLIYMLGFTPGFPYLGGMDKRIETPRLQTPRIKIPAGSVGIASTQTGIYPIDSPGGWQLIGRTPLKLYDENKENPILLKAGNYIKFIPITKEDFDKISSENGGEI